MTIRSFLYNYIINFIKINTSERGYNNNMKDISTALLVEAIVKAQDQETKNQAIIELVNRIYIPGLGKSYEEMLDDLGYVSIEKHKVKVKK